MNDKPATSISSRRIPALLLLILPSLTATACYAHGHGSLGGAALGLIVAASIAAGAWGAGLLLGAAWLPQRHRLSPLALRLIRPRHNPAQS